MKNSERREVIVGDSSGRGQPVNVRSTVMKALDRLVQWGDNHHPKILDSMRMALGIILFAKGIQFLNNAAYLRDMIIENHSIDQIPEVVSAIIIYVTYIHLAGGVTIFLGLFTRLSSLLQLPIVAGAVFFVNILSPFVNSELWLSVLVLVLLAVFVIIGSGPLSLDWILKTYAAKDPNNEHAGIID